MKSFTYYVLDVFTRERYRGNPLSVVITETDLDISDYEKIAREFGYSETSFMYFSEADKALKVRSFTPTGFEVHGAGHNLLGAVSTALSLGMDIFREQEVNRFVIMKDDSIRLLVRDDQDVPVIGMLQQPALIQAAVDTHRVAEALTLKPSALQTGGLAPTVVKTEVAHLMVPLKDLEILKRPVPVKPLLTRLAADYMFEGVYCFTLLKKDSGYLAQTRFFNPGIGIDEDPATGSAAGPLAGFLFENKCIQKDRAYNLLQGVQLNQPSVIQCEVTHEGVWISGSSVMVMEGRLYL